MSIPQDGDTGPRRYLISAVVADYPKNRDWNRPGLVQARARVVDLFTGTFGYRLHDALPLSPTRQQLTDALRAFCASPERREDDLLTLYLSCHGEILDDGEEHVLLTADTDPDDLTYTALPTTELTRAMLRGTRIRRVMLLLDACYVGQGGNQMAAAALERLGAAWGRSSGSGLVVVSSAQPHQQATAGLFPKLLEEAVTALSVAGHGPGTLSVDAVVQHMNGSKDLPGHQRIGLAMVGLDGEPPAFLPNPRHDVQLTEVDLALQQAAAFDEQDRRRESEFTSRLLVRAMGYQGYRETTDATDPGWWFSGRHTALRDLATWLNTPPGPDTQACRVVTAAPGSGKTAVLGLVAALTHPERRRTVPLDALGLPQDLIAPGTINAAVYAQRLTDTDILDAIAAAARLRTATGTVGELLDALDHRPRPLTVLIDALDEAATPHTLCTTILRPLVQHSRGRIRLLLGTRPYLLPRLSIDPTDTDHVIDLDSPRYSDHQALTTYTARTLLQARSTSPYRDRPHTVRPVAEAVATAAGHSFLIARITAGTLAATPTIPDPTDAAWRASLPRHAGDAMREDLHRRLGHHAQRATDLLRPLAFAEGQGLPWEDIWAPLATAISGRPYTDNDLLWLRHEAGSYVVEATANDRSAYRLYHEAMAEHLREDTDDRALYAAYVRVLTDRVPCRSDGSRDWSRAHPYALAHLAHHAAQAGLLDQVLADAEYLVHAEPRGLTPHLHHADHDTARLHAAVYRTGLHLHHDATPRRRRQVLALDAARAGAEHLHHDLTHRIPPGTWTPLWATGSSFNSALRDTFTGHTGPLYAVACTTLDGRPVAVTGSTDETVRVWDLTTGRPVGEPLTGHTGTVNAVACTTLDGRPVAVTGGYDKAVRVWDLATGRPVGEPLTGHTSPVTAMACTTLDGRPVAVTGGWDNTVRVWDLTTRRPVGSPLTGHTGTVNAVACTLLDGRPIAVTGSTDDTVRVWDLTTRRPVGSPLTGHTDTVTAVACTLLDGQPVAVTGSYDNAVRVWDLNTRRPMGEPLTSHTGPVHAVACAETDGRPVAVTGGTDRTVRVWDLTTGRAVGEPLTGHTGTVHAVACTTLVGQPVAVTGSYDNAVRVWDLATGRAVGEPLTGHTGTVNAVACTLLDGRPIAVTGSTDDTVRVWDLTTRRPVGEPLTGHTDTVAAVACTTLEGRPVAVTGSYDNAVRVWDLATGRAVGEPLTGHTGTVHAVACTVLDGRPVAVTGSWDDAVRVWDLATGRAVAEPLTGHTNTVHAVACTVLDGRPIAVTGSWDNTVRVWDLTTRRPVGEPLTGHTSPVTAMACTLLDGRPIAVTGSRDDTVRVWDLTTRRTIAEILTGNPRAVTLTTAGDLVIGFHHDIALYRRQPHDPTTRS
ncbi:caspase family protein [Kitasatospora indigofera]|uniref:caspase family protein n=1 Tax=Kitasatospora indigofera TaxID=67307 RepID=UPI0036CCE378